MWNWKEHTGHYHVSKHLASIKFHMIKELNNRSNKNELMGYFLKLRIFRITGSKILKKIFQDYARFLKNEIYPFSLFDIMQTSQPTKYLELKLIRKRLATVESMCLISYQNILELYFLHHSC